MVSPPDAKIVVLFVTASPSFQTWGGTFRTWLVVIGSMAAVGALGLAYWHQLLPAAIFATAIFFGGAPVVLGLLGLVIFLLLIALTVTAALVPVIVGLLAVSGLDPTVSLFPYFAVAGALALWALAVTPGIVHVPPDPDEVRREFGLGINGLETFRDLDALILAVGHSAYLGDLEGLSAMLRPGGVFVDLKSAFAPAELRPDLGYWSL